jgi:hypothetical protein
MYQIAIFWDSIEANKWLARIGYQIIDIKLSVVVEGGIVQCCIMVVYNTTKEDLHQEDARCLALLQEAYANYKKR